MIRNVILASASPRRHELLSRFIDKFDVIPADIDEAILADENHVDYVNRMAYQKCLTVSNLSNNSNDLIIAADTIVVKDNVIYGKPTDKKNATDILKQLRNSSHNVITSVCFNDKYSKTIDTFYKITNVRFTNFTDDFLEKYVSTTEPYDKAGGYGIQGMGSMLIDSIDGDYDSVVGLPIGELIRFFYKYNFNIF